MFACPFILLPGRFYHQNITFWKFALQLDGSILQIPFLVTVVVSVRNHIFDIVLSSNFKRGSLIWWFEYLDISRKKHRNTFGFLQGTGVNKVIFSVFKTLHVRESSWIHFTIKPATPFQVGQYWKPGQHCKSHVAKPLLKIYFNSSLFKLLH